MSITSGAPGIDELGSAIEAGVQYRHRNLLQVWRCGQSHTQWPKHFVGHAERSLQPKHSLRSWAGPRSRGRLSPIRRAAVSKTPWSSTRYSPTWIRMPHLLNRWCCHKAGRHRNGICSTDLPCNPSPIQETAPIAVAVRPRFVCYSEILALPGKNLYRNWNSPRLRDSTGVPWRHRAPFRCL